MQIVMGPMNLLDHKLASKILFPDKTKTNGKNKNKDKQDKFFDEKTRDELTDKDEIVDAEVRILFVFKFNLHNCNLTNPNHSKIKIHSSTTNGNEIGRISQSH